MNQQHIHTTPIQFVSPYIYISNRGCRRLAHSLSSNTFIQHQYSSLHNISTYAIGAAGDWPARALRLLPKFVASLRWDPPPLPSPPYTHLTTPWYHWVDAHTHTHSLTLTQACTHARLHTRSYMSCSRLLRSKTESYLRVMCLSRVMHHIHMCLLMSLMCMWRRVSRRDTCAASHTHSMSCVCDAFHMSRDTFMCLRCITCVYWWTHVCVTPHLTPVCRDRRLSLIWESRDSAESCITYTCDLIHVWRETLESDCCVLSFAREEILETLVSHESQASQQSYAWAKSLNTWDSYVCVTASRVTHMYVTHTCASCYAQELIRLLSTWETRQKTYTTQVLSLICLLMIYIIYVYIYIYIYICVYETHQKSQYIYWLNTGIEYMSLICLLMSLMYIYIYIYIYIYDIYHQTTHKTQNMSLICLLTSLIYTYIYVYIYMIYDTHIYIYIHICEIWYHGCVGCLTYMSFMCLLQSLMSQGEKEDPTKC